MSYDGRSLWSDGERYFIVPDDEPPAGEGLVVWTVARDERRLDDGQQVAFEVDEARADDFIQEEVVGTVPMLIQGLTALLGGSDPSTSPQEMMEITRGMARTMRAISEGDDEEVQVFRDRTARLAERLETQGRGEVAEGVRTLPDRLEALLGRSTKS